MSLNVADYINRRRDSVWERELAWQLRQLPEPERFQFIEEFLDHSLLGLDFAKACLTQRNYFEQLLQRGLKTADASTIFDWLECIVPKLGFRRVIGLLAKEVEHNTQAVDQALYWMFRLVPRYDSRSWHALQQLKALVASKGGGGALINYQQQGIPVREQEPPHSAENNVERRDGEPVFSGTEVPITALFDAIAKGQTLHQFLARFPAVSRQQALAVISNAQEKLVESYKIAA
jgi:uncharacterized protein (DUF433 family)